jgi:hypothetical protein
MREGATDTARCLWKTATDNAVIPLSLERLDDIAIKKGYKWTFKA